MIAHNHRPIERVEVSRLKPAPRNARTHSKRQIRQIADSIRLRGFTNPVLIDDRDEIIAGHGRVAAGKELGMTEVLCIRLCEMSAIEKRAYVIADNKLALNAGWDMENLAIELQDLPNEGFELSATGFELAEIDIILHDADQSTVDPVGPEDHRPQPQATAITRLGDHWVLGRHALMCGDAKEPVAVERLLAGRKADMIFTDPPYNVTIDGNVSGRGRIHHREFVEASGEMSPQAFTEFLRLSLAAAAGVCRDGAIAFVCIDWRHLVEIQLAGHAVFSQLKNLCVWAKTNAGMGTFYRSQHELILVWKVGSAPHTNTFGLGDKGRHRTNVWAYPGVNSFKPGRMDDIAAHPTVKPVALVSDAIRDVSNRGELVLDVFAGAGTTLIAAERTGRCARLLELDPVYCDVAIHRWQELTGKHAALLESGETFECVQAARGGAHPKARVEAGQ